MQQKKYGWDNFNKTQPIIGAIIILALIFFGFYLNTLKSSLPMYLFAGAMLGYTLTRARYGFAGGIKRIYMRGEGSLTKSILLLIAVTSVVFMALQWHAASKGALPYYMIEKGQAFIPGTQNVYFTNLATIVGGIIFGVGMMLAGGCGSGTVADFGEGEGRAMIAFIFFVIGAAPGQYARYLFDKTAIGQVGVRWHLPQTFGYVGALVITLLLLLVIYKYTLKYENMRKAEGTYMDPKGDYEDFEKPIYTEDKQVKFFSYETYHKLFIERWNFTFGAFILAIFAIMTMLMFNKAWGVSTPLVTLNVAIFQKLGFSFPADGFAKFISKVDAGLLSDGGTVRNIGLFFGCSIAFLMAGRFKIDFSFKSKDALLFALGGLLLGFGSRFAYGCNIGAMYSAISNFSFSGWIFLVAMSVGGIIGLKMFEGKICIISDMRKKQLSSKKK